VLGCQLDTTPVAIGVSPVHHAIAGAPADDVEDPDARPAAVESTAGAAAPRATVTPADEEPSAPSSRSDSATPASDASPASDGSPAPSADPGAPGPLPIHRYSFDGDGNAVRDSIGRASGVAIGARLQDGALRLDGTGRAHVQLPPGLLSRLSSASFEFWLTWDGDERRRFERIFEFGRTAGAPPDEKVGSSFFLSPSYDDGGGARVHFRSQTGESTRLFASLRFPTGAPVHVVVVLDSSAHSLALYLDGKPAGAAAWAQPLSSLQSDNAWLGRSQHEGDPFLAGSFDEFRIYSVALSAAQIEDNHARGPDRLAEQAPE